MYELSWSQGNTYRYGEYDLPIPDRPPEEEMVNYGLESEDQYFQRDEIPDVRNLDPEAQYEFIAGQWHKRKHGQWQLVNGIAIYLTGCNWFFLNHWEIEFGGLADFRMYQTELFYFWDYAVRDVNCFGINLYKPRRIGATEIGLCQAYEYVSRNKNVHSGMQNYTDDFAKEDFDRITEAHAKMDWWFKPINRGTDDPNKALDFKMPRKRITKRSVDQAYSLFGEEIDNDARALGSKITFKPTKLKTYDGTRLGRYRMGEFGKIENTTMNTVKQWEVVKKCLELEGGHFIIGKAFNETTVEEMEGGTALENANTFWEESDPGNKDENGRTICGLIRRFVNAIECAPVDQYGFPKKKEHERFLNNYFQKLEAEGKTDKLSRERRKNPITLDDVLTPAADKCPFDSFKLKKRVMQIKNDLTWRDEPTNKQPCIRGNFIWVNGDPETKQVQWVENPNGRWHVSWLPDDKDINRVTVFRGAAIPANINVGAIGVDPYDHAEVQADYVKSDGGIAIFRKYDDVIDGAKVDIDGHELTGDWDTHKFVAVYRNRPQEPTDFYEDVLKAAIFYGMQVFYESNKVGIRNHFYNRGYFHYLMLRPEETKSTWSRVQDRNTGAGASKMLINQYIEALESYIWKHSDHVDFELLLNEWLHFTTATRGKWDLAVASGFALLGATKKQPKIDEEETSNQEWHRMRSQEQVA